VLVPFIVAKMPAHQLAGGNKVSEEAQKYLNDVFTVFFSFMVFVALVAFFLMPYLIFFIAPGFTPLYQAKVILLSRIMLLSPILMGLSNLFGTVTQLFHKFFVYSLSPIFYNLGIIIGVIFLYPVFGITGLALGVALGALMHFGIQFFASRSCGFTPKFSLSRSQTLGHSPTGEPGESFFSFAINFKDIKNTILTSLPRTLGLAFNNIALIFIIAMASFLKSGSISIFNFSSILLMISLLLLCIFYGL